MADATLPFPLPLISSSRLETQVKTLAPMKANPKLPTPDHI